jgi:hemerythrin superfamily protein
MDALDLLEQQHRDTLALIDLVANEPRPGKRTALVITLVRAIEAHSRAEERCFYPAFRERIGDDARLYEAFEDHALMRLLAVNLLRTRATDVRFSARLKLVQETFLRHATAEEDWGFPKAKRHLTDENLDVIGIEVARAHEMLMHIQLSTRVELRPRRSAAAHRSQGAHRVSKRAQLSRCGGFGE